MENLEIIERKESEIKRAVYDLQQPKLKENLMIISKIKFLKKEIEGLRNG